MTNPPNFDHVFFVMMENKDYAEVIGDTTDAPYINYTLAAGGAVFSNWAYTIHPSEPNYLALLSGSTQSVTTDNAPFNGVGAGVTTLVDSLEAAGISWKAYMQSMPSANASADSGNYVVKHNPFAFFQTITGTPARTAKVVPTALSPAGNPAGIDALLSDLSAIATTPRFVWLCPDITHDMHNGASTAAQIQSGDAFLAAFCPQLFASPAWKQQNCLLVVLWDESDSAANVPVIFYGPSVLPGKVSAAAYTHYSWLRTLETAWGLPTLTANDAAAVSVSDVWTGSALTSKGKPMSHYSLKTSIFGPLSELPDPAAPSGNVQDPAQALYFSTDTGQLWGSTGKAWTLLGTLTHGAGPVALPTTPAVNVGFNNVAPTVTMASGGAVDAGTHVWAITNVATGGLEEPPGVSNTTAPVTVTAGTQTANLTSISAGPSNTIARNVYRSKAGTTAPLYFAGQIPDNTTTIFTGTLPDSSLGAAAPTIAAFADMTFIKQLIVDQLFCGGGTPDLTTNQIKAGIIFGGHVRLADSHSPTFSAPNAAISVAPALSPANPQSNDHKGFITFTTNATITGPAKLFTLTYGLAHGQQPVVLTKLLMVGQPNDTWAGTTSTTAADIYVGGSLPAAAYTLQYWAIS